MEREGEESPAINGRIVDNGGVGEGGGIVEEKPSPQTFSANSSTKKTAKLVSDPKFSKSVIWRSNLFSGQFLDPYMESNSLHNSLSRCALYDLIKLVELQLDFAQRNLNQPIGTVNFDMNNLSLLDQGDLEKVEEIIENLKTNTFAISVLHDKAGVNVNFVPKLLEKTLKCIDEMNKVGDMIVILGGWQPKKSIGHAIAYIVECIEPRKEFAWITCNTGEGVNNHHFSNESVYPRTKYKTSMRIDGIAYERIYCSKFWFMLYSQTLYSSDFNTADYYYETILPHLLGCRQDTNENMRRSFSASGDFKNPQISGTCSSRSVLTAFKYCLKRKGLSPLQMKQISAAIKGSFLTVIQGELESRQNQSSYLVTDFNDSDAYAIKLACKLTVSSYLKIDVGNCSDINIKLNLENISVLCEDITSKVDGLLLKLSESKCEESLILKYSRRLTIRSMGAIEISGIKGCSLTALNGICLFDPTEEEHGGVSVYRMRGDPNIWLEYGGGGAEVWIIKNTAQKGNNCGRAYVEVPSVCLPECIPSPATWKVNQTKDEWTDVDGVAVRLVADNNSGEKETLQWDEANPNKPFSKQVQSCGAPGYFWSLLDDKMCIMDDKRPKVANGENGHRLLAGSIAGTSIPLQPPSAAGGGGSIGTNTDAPLTTSSDGKDRDIDTGEKQLLISSKEQQTIDLLGRTFERPVTLIDTMQKHQTENKESEVTNAENENSSSSTIFTYPHDEKPIVLEKLLENVALVCKNLLQTPEHSNDNSNLLHLRSLIESVILNVVLEKFCKENYASRYHTVDEECISFRLTTFESVHSKIKTLESLQRIFGCYFILFFALDQQVLRPEASIIVLSMHALFEIFLRCPCKKSTSSSSTSTTTTSSSRESFCRDSLNDADSDLLKIISRLEFALDMKHYDWISNSQIKDPRFVSVYNKVLEYCYLYNSSCNKLINNGRWFDFRARHSNLCGIDVSKNGMYGINSYLRLRKLEQEEGKEKEKEEEKERERKKGNGEEVEEEDGFMILLSKWFFLDENDFELPYLRTYRNLIILTDRLTDIHMRFSILSPNNLPANAEQFTSLCIRSFKNNGSLDDHIICKKTKCAQGSSKNIFFEVDFSFAETRNFYSVHSISTNLVSINCELQLDPYRYSIYDFRNDLLNSEDFDGKNGSIATFSPQEANQFYSFTKVPHLAPVLALNFIAANRVHLLTRKKFQTLLDILVFLPKGNPVLSRFSICAPRLAIPAGTKYNLISHIKLLGKNHEGVLFDDTKFSPDIFLDPLIEISYQILALVVGSRFSDCFFDAFLYVARLSIAILQFCSFHVSDFLAGGKKEQEQEDADNVRVLSSSSFIELCKLLLINFVDVLKKWVHEAEKDQNYSVLILLHSYISTIAGLSIELKSRNALLLSKSVPDVNISDFFISSIFVISWQFYSDSRQKTAKNGNKYLNLALIPNVYDSMMKLRPQIVSFLDEAKARSKDSQSPALVELVTDIVIATKFVPSVFMEEKMRINRTSLSSPSLPGYFTLENSKFKVSINLLTGNLKINGLDIIPFPNNIFQNEDFKKVFRNVISSVPTFCRRKSEETIEFEINSYTYEINQSDNKVVIRKNNQVFIPSNILLSMQFLFYIPLSILDDYLFWKDDKKSLKGYKTGSDIPSLVIDSAGIHQLDVSSGNKVLTLVKLFDLDGLALDEWVCERRNNDNNSFIFEKDSSENDAGRSEKDSRGIECDDGAGSEGMIKSRSPLWAFINELSKIEEAPYILAWRAFNSSKFEADIINLPRLNISFDCRAADDDGRIQYVLQNHKDDLRFYSSDSSNGKQNDTDHGILTLAGNFKNFILLTNPVGILHIFLPSYGISKKLCQLYPFKVDLIFDKTKKWFNSVKSRYFIYPIHPTCTHLEMLSCSEALYWVLILFLHHRYEEAAKIITTVCQTDLPLTKEQNWILDQFPKTYEVNAKLFDMHPDAHACRLLLNVMLLDIDAGSQQEEDNEESKLSKAQSCENLNGKIFVEKDLKSYYKKFSYVSRLSKLTEREESLIYKYIRRSTIRSMGAIEIAGIKGCCLTALNGICLFDPTEEEHGGVSVYRMRGDPDTRLEYEEGGLKMWRITSTVQKGNNCGRAYIEVPSVCLPECIPSPATWKVNQTIGEWKKIDGVTVRLVADTNNGEKDKFRERNAPISNVFDLSFGKKEEIIIKYPLDLEDDYDSKTVIKNESNSHETMQITPFYAELDLFRLLTECIDFIPGKIEICGSFALNLFQRCNKEDVLIRGACEWIDWQYNDVDIFVTSEVIFKALLGDFEKKVRNLNFTFKKRTKIMKNLDDCNLVTYDVKDKKNRSYKLQFVELRDNLASIQDALKSFDLSCTGVSCILHSSKHSVESLNNSSVRTAAGGTASSVTAVVDTPKAAEYSCSFTCVEWTRDDFASKSPTLEWLAEGKSIIAREDILNGMVHSLVHPDHHKYHFRHSKYCIRGFKIIVFDSDSQNPVFYEIDSSNLSEVVDEDDLDYEYSFNKSIELHFYYASPEKMNSTEEAVRFLHAFITHLSSKKDEWGDNCDKFYSIRGNHDGLGFIFFYELILGLKSLPLCNGDFYSSDSGNSRNWVFVKLFIKKYWSIYKNGKDQLWIMNVMMQLIENIENNIENIIENNDEKCSSSSALLPISAADEASFCALMKKYFVSSITGRRLDYIPKFVNSGLVVDNVTGQLTKAISLYSFDKKFFSNLLAAFSVNKEGSSSSSSGGSFARASEDGSRKHNNIKKVMAQTINDIKKPISEFCISAEAAFRENISRYEQQFGSRPTLSDTSRDKVSVRVLDPRAAQKPLSNLTIYKVIEEEGRKSPEIWNSKEKEWESCVERDIYFYYKFSLLSKMPFSPCTCFSKECSDDENELLPKARRQHSRNCLVGIVTEIRREIECALVANLSDVIKGIESIEDELNNKTGPIDNILRLRHISGLNFRIDFNFIASSLVSNHQLSDLQKRNEYITEDLIEDINSRVVAILFSFQRYRQLATCCSHCIGLLAILNKNFESSDIEANSLLRSKVIALVDELMKERHYVGVRDDGSCICEFDPRFLIFEYLSGFLLKERQIALIRNFVLDAKEEKSRIEGMIMGQGKTAVIAPLLAMMLADGKSLVTIICPDSLIQQSRLQMKQKFSYILPKSIWALNYDRSSSRCNNKSYLEALSSKLDNARRDKGLVLSTPQAIKSIFLKFIELNILPGITPSSSNPNSSSNRSSSATNSNANESTAIFDIGVLTLALQKNISIGKKRVNDALYDAVEAGSLDTINELLIIAASNGGADEINSVYIDKKLPGWLSGKGNGYKGTSAGNSVLHLACWMGVPRQIVESLLELGADVNLKSKSGGCSALILASCKGHRDIVELLLLRGANIHHRDNEGDNALILASYKGHMRLIELLLERGANIHDQNYQGDDSLISASLMGHRHVVELLLDRGANINHKNNNKGYNALIYACQEGHIQVVELLLFRGAHFHDKLAQIVASKKGHKDILGLFKDRSTGKIFSKYENRNILKRIIDLWENGIAILDEVDLLLHPLKSELNFPIGDAMKTFPYLPFRFDMPLYLLSVFMSFSDGDVGQQHVLVQEVFSELQVGIKDSVFMTNPHLVLMDDDWYQDHLVSKVANLLSSWMIRYLERSGIDSILKDKKLEWKLAFIKSFISVKNDSFVAPEFIPEIEWLLKVESDYLKRNFGRLDDDLSERIYGMLVLCREWVMNILPHCLSRRHRVNFGLISPEDIKRWQDEEVENAGGDEKIRNKINPSLSRRLLAVPFVGKDVPSQSSEFADPEVTIGLSILAYRHQGLRRDDIDRLLNYLIKEFKNQSGPHSERPASKQFDVWRRNSSNTGTCMGITLPELRFIKLSDEDQFSDVWSCFKSNSEIIDFYLCNLVFPNVLKLKEHKLQANGVDLGGDMLFKQRLGFTGTPSKLLPLELEDRCFLDYEDDRKIRDTLVDKDVIICPEMFQLDKSWTVDSIIDLVGTDGNFGAFIDTGALITGYTAEQVAKYIMNIQKKKKEKDACDPSVKEAVVFIDDRGYKQFVDWGGNVFEFDKCGVKAEKYLVFFDHVHTTGIDINLSSNAVAICTLGKDMTLRDFAQGCWRMRGIGKGQKIHIVIVPEIKNMIGNTSCAIDLSSSSNSSSSSSNGSVGEHEIIGEYKCSMQNSILKWLDKNSEQSENFQKIQLKRQVICNIWRKQVFHGILSAKTAADVSMQLFIEPLLLGAKDGSQKKHLEDLVEIFDKEVKSTINYEIMPMAEKKLLESLTLSTPTSDSMPVSSSSNSQNDHISINFGSKENYNMEVVQEQEKEQEVEMQSNNQKEASHAHLYTADDASSVTYSLESLLEPNDPHWVFSKTFIKMNELYASLDNKRQISLPFPDYLYVSKRYVDTSATAILAINRIKQIMGNKICGKDGSSTKDAYKRAINLVLFSFFDSPVSYLTSQRQQCIDDELMPWEKYRGQVAAKLGLKRDATIPDIYDKALEAGFQLAPKTKTGWAKFEVFRVAFEKVIGHLDEEDVILNSTSRLTTCIAKGTVFADVNVLLEVKYREEVESRFVIISLAEAEYFKMLVQRRKKLREVIGLHLIYPTLNGKSLFAIVPSRLDQKKDNTFALAIVGDKEDDVSINTINARCRNISSDSSAAGGGGGGGGEEPSSCEVTKAKLSLINPIDLSSSISISECDGVESKRFKVLFNHDDYHNDNDSAGSQQQPQFGQPGLAIARSITEEMKNEAFKFSQLVSAIQFSRFFNNEIYFDDKSLYILLQSLTASSKEDRRAFFDFSLKNCRLRDSLNYNSNQVSYVFNFNDSAEMEDLFNDVIDIKRRLIKQQQQQQQQEKVENPSADLAFKLLKKLASEELQESNMNLDKDSISVKELIIGLSKLENPLILDEYRVQNLIKKCHNLLYMTNPSGGDSSSETKMSRSLFCALFPLSETDKIRSPRGRYGTSPRTGSSNSSSRSNSNSNSSSSAKGGA